MIGLRQKLENNVFAETTQYSREQQNDFMDIHQLYLAQDTFTTTVCDKKTYAVPNVTISVSQFVFLSKIAFLVTDNTLTVWHKEIPNV